MAIIYIHGFAGSGASEKASLLREHFPDETVVSPDLPVDPLDVEALFDQLVKSLLASGQKKFLLVGASLGGFYAWYLSARYDCPALLVNPSIEAPLSMAKRVGAHKNLNTGADFDWKEEYQETLATMRSFAIAQGNPKLIEVVVALDDEVLDASVAIKHFEGQSPVHVFDTGKHRFSDFNRAIPRASEMYAKINENMIF